MSEAQFDLSRPDNEPVLEYGPDSPEKREIKSTLARMADSTVDIPIVIGGEEIRTGDQGRCVMPHEHGHALATYHTAGPEEVCRAIEASAEAWNDWSRLPWAERVSVFLKAAELLAGPWRSTINGATMLGQSKTVYQAEIDAACELIDFFRYNAHFTGRIYAEQPMSTAGIWDRAEWRPHEGFVFAVSPFNFTSIAGNLPTAPAMMGNTVVWKPASSAVYSGYYLMRLLEAAGLPPGVINFVPGPGRAVGETALTDPRLAGVHFTGSTPTFNRMWRVVGENIDRYRGYPRLVGETGGKDFVVAHASAEVGPLTTALLRGAFEYQGQKCSAASRAYVPGNLWPELRDKLVCAVAEIRMGDPADFTNFMGAVIDEAAFDNIAGYIDLARVSDETSILVGGGHDKSRGYFVEPTVVQSTDPHHRLMEEEIFGPVLTIHVYPEKEYEQVLELCDGTSPYALTGSVFAGDRYAIHAAHRILRHAAGNFYVNDKPTGAVVGMQPFGGSRKSGTNDKAGSLLNLLRWVSPRTIKETFDPPTFFPYPHMLEE